MKQPITNKPATPWFYQITNGLLVLLFAYDLGALGRLHQKAKAAASSNLLATDPAKLLQAIHNTDPAWWVWAITIISLVISTVLLAGWWLPQFAKWRPRYRSLSLIWILIWVAYLISIGVRASLAINKFFG